MFSKSSLPLPRRIQRRPSHFPLTKINISHFRLKALCVQKKNDRNKTRAHKKRVRSARRVLLPIKASFLIRQTIFFPLTLSLILRSVKVHVYRNGNTHYTPSCVLRRRRNCFNTFVEFLCVKFLDALQNRYNTFSISLTHMQSALNFTVPHFYTFCVCVWRKYVHNLKKKKTEK